MKNLYNFNYKINKLIQTVHLLLKYLGTFEVIRNIRKLKY